MIIITRTHQRPNYFAQCCKSITDQQFSGRILHIVLFQGQDFYVSDVNTSHYRRVVLQVPDVEQTNETKVFEENGMHLKHMPWNLHMRVAYDYIKKQKRPENEIVLGFDDDDMLARPDALQTIYETCRKIQGSFVALWRADFRDKLIPDDQHWKRVEICHISGIAFAYPVSLIPFADYGQWQCGDYRTIKSMMRQADYHVWIDKVLTAIQRPHIEKTSGDLPVEMHTVRGCNVEFGYELISAVPYAYWLHEQGLLKETISGAGSEALYWFSPKHTIDPSPRMWANMREFRASVLPNTTIHRSYIDTERFKTPPYRKVFNAKIPEFTRPVVCICNRYNREWCGEPTNFFDIKCLDRLFALLEKKYTVVYFAVDIPQEFEDGASPLPLYDRELIKEKHPEVLVFQDLVKKYGWDWNAFMLTVFSQCQRFITMNGGYSIMASYFGGTNLIYSVKCSEINPAVNSFMRWYHKFGESRVMHLSSYDELYEAVENVYVKQQPLINILIRTSGRPAYFNECMRSIREQTHKNVQVVVSVDDDETARYVQPYKVRMIRCKPELSIPDPPLDIIVDDKVIYGRKAFYNLYLNDLNKEVSDGWVLWHDDDMQFAGADVLERAAGMIKSENDLIMWRVFTNGTVVPQDEHFGQKPWNCDITASCLFHSKHLHLIRWEPYRKGNYRVMSVLYKHLHPVWIDKIMATTGEVGSGLRKDKQTEIEKLYL